jgi:hypothetical protein
MVLLYIARHMFKGSSFPFAHRSSLANSTHSRLHHPRRSHEATHTIEEERRNRLSCSRPRRLTSIKQTSIGGRHTSRCHIPILCSGANTHSRSSTQLFHNHSRLTRRQLTHVCHATSSSESENTLQLTFDAKHVLQTQLDE